MGTTKRPSINLSFHFKTIRAIATWGERGALYLLVLLMPLSVYWPLGQSFAHGILQIYVTPGIYLSDLAVCALLLVFLLRWDRRQRRQMKYLSLALLLIVGLALVTTPTALSPALAGYTALRWMVAFAIYLILVHSDQNLDHIVIVFLCGLGIHTLIGIGQVITQGPLGIPGELALELSRPRAAAIHIAGEWWLRAYGLTFHPNVLGGFLTIGLIVGLPLLKRPFVRILWWLLLVGLVLTFSRSAWLAALLVVPSVSAWLVWRSPNMRKPIGIAIGGVALIGLVSGILFARQINSRLSVRTFLSEYTSLIGRGELIEIAIQEIVQRPITGVGAGNFPLTVLNADTLDPPHAVHNLPLLFAAEIGVIGGVLWIWLWLAPGLALNPLQKDITPWAVVLVGAWLALGSIGLWDSYPWSLNAGRLLTVTLLAWTSRVLAK